jgi:hypothetical protein
VVEFVVVSEVVLPVDMVLEVLLPIDVEVPSLEVLVAVVVELLVGPVEVVALVPEEVVVVKEPVVPEDVDDVVELDRSKKPPTMTMEETSTTARTTRGITRL